ncbi:MAG TPA: PQQ-binding-like beta-propeller repeat protein, partial [archaeon]|nr:PQQ-binding-like beta-propeller repeat protein [archaeon]
FKTGGFVASGILSHNNRLYFPSLDKKLYCIDYEGKLLWSFRTPESVTGTGIIAEYNSVYFGCRDNNMYAVSADTGNLIWKLPAENMIVGAYSTDDKNLYFGSTDYSLYAIDKKAGTLLWKYKTNGILVSRPVIFEGKIFFGNWNGKFYCLSITGEQLWEFQASSKPPSHIHVAHWDETRKKIVEMGSEILVDIKKDPEENKGFGLDQYTGRRKPVYITSKATTGYIKRKEIRVRRDGTVEEEKYTEGGGHGH